MQHVERLGITIPLVEVGHRLAVDVHVFGVGGNVVPLKVGGAQVKGVGVGVAVVYARVAEQQRVARLHGVVGTAAGYHVERPDGHGVLAYVGGVLEILGRLELRLAESQSVGIEHVVGVVVNLDVAVAIILQSRTAQRAGEEYLLDDEVVVVGRQKRLYLHLSAAPGNLYVLSLAVKSAFGLRRLVVGVVGGIGDVGRVDHVVEPLGEGDALGRRQGGDDAGGEVGNLYLLAGDLHAAYPHGRRNGNLRGGVAGAACLQVGACCQHAQRHDVEYKSCLHIPVCC